MRESKDRKIKRAVKVVQLLYKEYPNAKCSLNYNSVHELLVATILSAQCTDHRVNIVTKDLFRKYRSPEDYAYCEVNELDDNIHSCGYHNQKAKSIQGSSLMILEEFNGKVPHTMEDLIRLPGVGRKTANCILGEIYGIPSMVIDTHMIRIMNLLGLIKEKDAKKIEFNLMLIFNKDDWVKLTHMIIDHGRAICIARRPKCNDCVLETLCPSTTV